MSEIVLGPAPVGATFGALRSDLDNLAGLDLTPDERDRLLNEGYVELCTQAEWTRATLNFGPTVADQADYGLPAVLDGQAGERILEVSVGGKDYEQGTAEQARAFKLGDLRRRAYGIYWLGFDDTGDERVSLYPAPTTAGADISALCVVEPTELTDDDNVPRVPRRFRRALLHYAASIAYAFDEDNADLHAYHQQAFSDFVAELRMLRFSRTGRGPVTMQIQGVHW